MRGIVLIMLTLLTFVFFRSEEARSQDKLEMGLFGGVSYYLGDLNHSQQFKSPRPAFGFIARYVISDRLAAKLNIIGGGIAGKYPANGECYPDKLFLGTGTSSTGREPSTLSYSFERMLVDVGVTGEFNFRSFDHMFNQDQSRFAPYMTIGLATTIYKSYKDYSTWKTDFVLSLPFGLGMKYKVNKWLRVGAEWTMRKSFADDLDYVDPEQADINTNDPFGSGVHKLTHNNDWYSFCGFTVTASMWPRKLSCNDGLRNFNK